MGTERRDLPSPLAAEGDSDEKDPVIRGQVVRTFLLCSLYSSLLGLLLLLEGLVLLVLFFSFFLRSLYDGWMRCKISRCELWIQCDEP